MKRRERAEGLTFFGYQQMRARLGTQSVRRTRKTSSLIADGDYQQVPFLDLHARACMCVRGFLNETVLCAHTFFFCSLLLSFTMAYYTADITHWAPMSQCDNFGLLRQLVFCTGFASYATLYNYGTDTLNENKINKLGFDNALCSIWMFESMPMLLIT